MNHGTINSVPQDRPPPPPRLRSDRIAIGMSRLEAEHVVENLRTRCDSMREELAMDSDPELRGILSGELVTVNRVINRLLEELA